MEQIRLMSKLGLALMIAITAISVAVATHAYNIQTADAQARLPNNSVTSQTIVNGQVQTDDLANNAVTTAKIADGAITSEKIAEGAGGGAVELVVVERTVQGSIPANSFGAVAVSCNSDETVVGGGYSKVSSETDVFSSTKEDNGWEVSAFNSESFTQIIHVVAECAQLTQ